MSLTRKNLVRKIRNLVGWRGLNGFPTTKFPALLISEKLILKNKKFNCLEGVSSFTKQTNNINKSTFTKNKKNNPSKFGLEVSLGGLNNQTNKQTNNQTNNQTNKQGLRTKARPPWGTER